MSPAREVVLLSGDGWTADNEPVTVPHTWNAVDGSRMTVRFRNAEKLYIYNEVDLPLGPFHAGR